MSTGALVHEALVKSALRKSEESAQTQLSFFKENAGKVAACAEAMSAAFTAGGRLFTLGNGGSACDAEHLSVEFMHPVLEKRVALPAMALSNDGAFLSAIANDQDSSLGFQRQLSLLAKKGDMVLGVSTSGQSRNVNRALAWAKEQGILTIGFTGKDGGKLKALCDHPFVVPSFSIHRIQETHQVLLHLIWDLLHVARGEEDVL